MSENIEFDVHSIVQNSTVYGPGVRWVLWVQGCTLGCKGCWNVETWQAGIGKKYTLSELIESINQSGDIEGITILGGEPLQQKLPVLRLIEHVKNLGLTVMLYTGYVPKEFDEIMWQCYNLSDIAITGRYVESMRDLGLIWRGSTNQRLESPTGRYDVSFFEEEQEVEIQIDHATGELTVTGYPDVNILAMVEELTGNKLNNSNVV